MDELKSTLNRGSANLHPLSPGTRTKTESDGKRLSDDDENRITTPSALYHSGIENYFRESKWRLEVFIYQCECWSDSTYFTVPFIQRAECGIKSFTKSFQKQNDLPDTLSISAIQQHKAFKFSPPTFSIKYSQMNIVGAVKQAAPIEPKSYNSIIVSNVPSQADKGAVPPNPTKPWLEMICAESDPKKRKAKGKDSDESLSCYHLSQVELEADDKKKNFHILLDNVLYGPFYKIRISPCNVTQEEILSIPFMTFFPLEFPF